MATKQVRRSHRVGMANPVFMHKGTSTWCLLKDKSANGFSLVKFCWMVGLELRLFIIFGRFHVSCCPSDDLTFFSRYILVTALFLESSSMVQF